MTRLLNQNSTNTEDTGSLIHHSGSIKQIEENKQIINDK